MIDVNEKLFKWGPIESVLLLLGYPTVVSFGEMKKLFGASYPETSVIFDRDKATWICELKKIEASGKEFTELNILPDKARKKFYDTWEERVNKLGETQRLVNNIENLNDKELKIYSLSGVEHI